ncbi:MAG: hypothetical protein J6D43_20165, partial [Pseudomonas sp.]|nr:hypothetical protein [Pseudomonas sp.]
SCGSGLARDAGDAGDAGDAVSQLNRAHAIAGSPLPQMTCAGLRGGVSTRIQVLEPIHFFILAAAVVSFSQTGTMAPFAAKRMLLW